MLRLQLFGVPRLFDAADQVVSFGRGQLGLRLLIFLALRGERGAVADSLYDHVWPLTETNDDDDDETGASATEKVRHAIKRVRSVLAGHAAAGREAVRFEASLYRLNLAVIWAPYAWGCAGERRWD